MGIGVTDFIALSDVRRELDSEYPNQGPDVTEELRVEHEEHDYTVLGTVFDYLCHFWLEHRCEKTYKPKKSLDTTIARAEWAKQNLPTEDEDYEDPHLRAKRKKDAFVQTGMNAADAVDAALIFAGKNLDIGEGGEKITASSFEESIVTELQDLFHIFRGQDEFDGEMAIISPDFGTHSYILEGEGDFIVDGTLIDVKTTESPSFKPSYWRQLLSYYILNDIHREMVGDSGEIPYPELERVGIYFARYGVSKIINVDDIINSREEFERFRAWFVDRAIEENHDGRINYDDVREMLTDPYDFERQRSLFDF
ncbi:MULTISPECIES: hypothetical protein [Haloferax]|uniref:PD-(D/E)XK endonuclease-like domain-containing protein n=1 Tax=Haloferax marinum TaxID=2666143 RepID=A0A6A8GA05_9EURY|nr:MULTISPECIES: hypothetical protein [Haloferax]KAB1197872.1 hypothetical protein Hfx1150_10220 [Haloferax sp. CBA1150]MRW96936.1 hypothetical protein [Haloferax marinum]